MKYKKNHTLQTITLYHLMHMIIVVETGELKSFWYLYNRNGKLINSGMVV